MNALQAHFNQGIIDASVPSTSSAASARQQLFPQHGEFIPLAAVFNTYDTEDGKCLICTANDATVFGTCRHKCMCKGCTKRYIRKVGKKCPVCRKWTKFYEIVHSSEIDQD
jgi:hypothetical protein